MCPWFEATENNTITGCFSHWRKMFRVSGTCSRCLFFFIISVEISYTWKDIGRRTKASLRMRCKRFQSSYCTKFGARANEKIDRLGRGRSHFLDMLATQAQIKVNVMNAKLQYRRMYVYLAVCSALCHWSQASTESIFSPRTILVNF